MGGSFHSYVKLPEGKLRRCGKNGMRSPLQSKAENTNFCVSGRPKKKNAGSCGTPGTPGTLFWPVASELDSWHFMLNFPHFHAELRYKKVAFPFYKNHQKRNRDAKRCSKRRVTCFFQCRTSCWILWPKIGRLWVIEDLKGLAHK